MTHVFQSLSPETAGPEGDSSRPAPGQETTEQHAKADLDLTKQRSDVAPDAADGGAKFEITKQNVAATQSDAAADGGAMFASTKREAAQRLADDNAKAHFTLPHSELAAAADLAQSGTAGPSLEPLEAEPELVWPPPDEQELIAPTIPAPVGQANAMLADVVASEAAAEPGAAVDEATETIPIDSAKTFIGINGTYYDESWRWMEWRGQTVSWNWAAALSFGGWLAYRRLYALAGANLAWLSLLIALAINGAPLRLLAVAQIAAGIVLGCYGNTLYMHQFRRAAATAARGGGEFDDRLARLARVGGTDSRAVYFLFAAAAGVAAALTFLTLMARGSVALSF